VSIAEPDDGEIEGAVHSEEAAAEEAAPAEGLSRDIQIYQLS